MLGEHAVGHFAVGDGGDDQDRGERLQRLHGGIAAERGEGVEQVDAAHLRHHDVEHDDGVRLRGDPVQRLDAVARRLDADVRVRLQVFGEELADGVVILDHEDAVVGHRIA